MTEPVHSRSSREEPTMRHNQVRPDGDGPSHAVNERHEREAVNALVVLPAFVLSTWIVKSRSTERGGPPPRAPGPAAACSGWWA